MMNINSSTLYIHVYTPPPFLYNLKKKIYFKTKTFCIVYNISLMNVSLKHCIIAYRKGLACIVHCTTSVCLNTLMHKTSSRYCKIANACIHYMVQVFSTYNTFFFLDVTNFYYKLTKIFLSKQNTYSLIIKVNTREETIYVFVKSNVW